MIKLKIILMFTTKKKHFYFQYIKTCLWLLVYFLLQGTNLEVKPRFNLI